MAFIVALILSPDKPQVKESRNSIMKNFIYIALYYVAVCNGETLVGQFTTKQHGVTGSIYEVDDNTIKIKNFNYDGTGPDAFFYVGTSGQPSSSGVHIKYPAGSDAILEEFNDGEVTLTLPNDLEVDDLKWISVWCRQYSVNFGDFYFADDEKSDGESGSVQVKVSTASLLFVFLIKYIW